MLRGVIVTAIIILMSIVVILVAILFIYIVSISKTIGKTHFLFVWVLWHINLCRLFNAKSLFILKIVLFQVIQFRKSTQFKSQNYFKQFSLA